MFERISSCLSYEPATGDIRWRVQQGRARAGALAGVVNGHGYRVVRFDGRLFPAHRIAWCLQTGQWPERDIDHANGQRTDNRWANLRLATQTQNNANARLRRDNKTGLKGVRQQGHRFVAAIRSNGIAKHLGSFSTAEAAHAAYIKAAQKIFGEFARSN